jgi:hypothetical protein
MDVLAQMRNKKSGDTLYAATAYKIIGSWVRCRLQGKCYARKGLTTLKS